MKRARTEESTTSSGSGGLALPPSNGNSDSKGSGAAAVKPTEIAVEQVNGKKKSKYWFYAVEPAPSPSGNEKLSSLDSRIPIIMNGQSPTDHESNEKDVDCQINGSILPLPEK